MNPQMAPAYGNQYQSPSPYQASGSRGGSFKAGGYSQVNNQMVMPYQEPYTGGHYMMGMGNNYGAGMYGMGQAMAPYSHSLNPREFEMELSGIRSVDEVMIDHTSVLAIKRGDLAII
jgi:hypothetical protein